MSPMCSMLPERTIGDGSIITVSQQSTEKTHGFIDPLLLLAKKHEVIADLKRQIESLRSRDCCRCGQPIATSRLSPTQTLNRQARCNPSMEEVLVERPTLQLEQKRVSSQTNDDASDRLSDSSNNSDSGNYEPSKRERKLLALLRDHRNKIKTLLTLVHEQSECIKQQQISIKDVAVRESHKHGPPRVEPKSRDVPSPERLSEVSTQESTSLQINSRETEVAATVTEVPDAEDLLNSWTLQLGLDQHEKDSRTLEHLRGTETNRRPARRARYPIPVTYPTPEPSQGRGRPVRKTYDKKDGSNLRQAVPAKSPPCVKRPEPTGSSCNEG